MVFDQTIPHLLEYLEVATLVFLIGVAGIFLNRKNIIVLLMSLELMLLSINMMFVSSSMYFKDVTGMVFALFVLTVAAAESAIGLAILVIFYRIKRTIDLESINILKG